MPSASRQQDPHDLVHFDDPPVIEVALSVQFPPDSFGFDAVARFAEASKRDLPDRQYQPLSPPMTEDVGIVDAPAIPPFEIRFEGSVRLPRIWFVGADRTELVQIQHDRFTLNWRRLGEPANRYLRYSHLRSRLSELLGRLESSASQRVAPNLCEVTYVNAIKPAENRTSAHPFSDPAQVLEVMKRGKQAFLPDPQDVQLQSRWEIPGTELGLDSETTLGRLHLNMTPGLSPLDQTPVYFLNLTGRVRPIAPDRAAAFQAMDLAHKWVVLGFKDLTTATMHRVWRINEAEAR